MKGLLLAGGNGSRLDPLTRVVSKQLLPVYNKPMIYYPLTTLILAGVTDVLVVTKPEDKQSFSRLLGDGSEFEINIEYAEQTVPRGIADAILVGEKFLGQEEFVLILGDNLIYGQGFGRNLSKFRTNDGASIFAFKVATPEEFGIVEFDEQEKPSKLIEKPSNTNSNWAIPGLYFYDNTAVARVKKLKPSKRNELEITDLNMSYLNDNKLNVHKIPLGTAWLDLGNPDSLIDAGHFIQTLEKRQGLRIGDPWQARSTINSIT